MKKFVAAAVFAALLTAVPAADLVLFENGKVNGNLLTKAEIRDNALIFDASQALKLKIAPVEKDLTKYGTFEMEFSSNRAADQWKFTMTVENTPDKKWHYFSTPNLTIEKKGEQTLVIDLDDMAPPSSGAVRKGIASLDFHLRGWDMPFKKGLVVSIRKMVLKERKNMVLASVESFPGDTAAKRTLYSKGKVAGKLPGLVFSKKGELLYRNNDAPRLTIVPANHDFSGYDTLNITFTPNRGGDRFLFTMTSNPKGAKNWNYYNWKFITIASGKQTVSFPLKKLTVSRKPVGMHSIDSAELCFRGWELDYKKGLILTVDEIWLSADAEAQKAEAEQAAAQKKNAETAEKQLKYLPLKPWISVPHVSDRTFWESKKSTRFAQNLLNKHAKRALETPAKMPSREHYLDFMRNGNRNQYEKEYTPVMQGFENLTMALCITGDKEKYLKQWTAYAEVLADMPTWVYPAHDKDYRNLSGKNPSLELVGTSIGASIAIARQALKGWIPESTDKKLEQQLRRQLITPFLNTVHGKRYPDWFIKADSNWNAVCFGNLMRIILASDLPETDKKDAFRYILANSRNYLRGFGADGYCTEGIAYWTYGYGHYLILAASVYSASNGKVNLLDDPAARLAARFPERIMLSPQYFPAFSDCYFAAGVGDTIEYLVNYLLKNPAGDPSLPAGNFTYQLAVWGLPAIPEKKKETFVPERFSSFPRSGVYIFRSPSPDALRIALKGGHNEELHNHNDIGSYSIAYPLKNVVVGDLGGAVYTKQSFSKDRYKDPVLASYGHSVPLIDGITQSEGRSCCGKVLSAAEDGKTGLVVIDLSKAYPGVNGLKKLERSFSYRYTDGETVITDKAEFDEKRAFEVALMTFGVITDEGNGVLKAQYQDSAIRIKVDTAGVPWTLKHETLPSDVNWKNKAQRYAVVLKDKQLAPVVKMTFSPSK